MTTPKIKKTESAQPIMGRGFGMLQGGKPAKNFRGTMRQLIKYLKPFWISIIMVFVFAIASTVFAIISPKILGKMTNQIIMDLMQRTAVHYDKLWEYASMLIGLYLLSAGFSYVQGWIMTRVAQDISFRFRKDLAAKINKLPIKYFDQQTHGETISLVTNDIDTVSQTLNQSLTQIITSITLIIGILAMMLSISWHMTLVTLILLPLSFTMIGLIAKFSQKYFKQQQATLGHINGHIEEMYSGHVIMRLFNGEQRSIQKFNTINKELYISGWKSQFFAGLLMPLMGFFGNLGYVGVAVVGGWLAVNGRINIGDIQAFIQYVQQFNQPIIQTANMASVMQSTAAAAERVFEFLAISEENNINTVPVTLNTVKGNVEFKNVMFGYQPDKTIIHNFSARVKAGQRVAIVGPTGAGKTTMVNLLMRFYDVTSGTITIDGVNIQELDRAKVRTMFGMVLQDTWLFNGTIRDNIRYGKPEASAAEILAVAKSAHVDHFVSTLPQGYDTIIDEEANNISQGEKQLLTIARAMLINPPMLILDEATSAVDTRTERLIQQAMERLMLNRTSFVIAHRLSTIKHADLILVMRAGNIIEQGTHTNLLAQNGFYAELYNSQFSISAA
ncbi:MAG: ABC transporter ATP-binding protein [Patescibacteria group bacterium]|jgi:ATP-binding cassette subfamily B protein